MKNFIKTSLIALALAAPAVAAVPSIAYAAPATVITASAQALPSGDFVKKKKSIKGDWTVVQENSQTIIRFSDDFKTKNGPDLKIFLSPQSIGSVTGKTAVDGAVLLGVLKSNKGAQDYVLPAGVSLASFSSVLIHCEAYSILWGGGAL
ncbi:DM13 domain-containing protein [Fretibacter rubidus]|uniref:DM13 domain-containing protein n=1 Tax=Fretibacter rubidus TaxID=570162 RepID=UPI00352AD7BB